MSSFWVRFGIQKPLFWDLRGVILAPLGPFEVPWGGLRCVPLPVFFCGGTSGEQVVRGPSQGPPRGTRNPSKIDKMGGKVVDIFIHDIQMAKGPENGGFLTLGGPKNIAKPLEGWPKTRFLENWKS